jgi:hypothetical protein
MHLEILVEDQSGKRMLDILVPRIIGDDHTFCVHPYKGVGRIPKNMKDTDHAEHRILLQNLPKLLKGFGRTFANYPSPADYVLIMVCDLDDKCLKQFRAQLHAILNACNPKPETRFCIAIEEGEAWILGDLPAIKRAYPRAKEAVLRRYVSDSICGTWECLADAVYPGGAAALGAKGWQAVGAEKSAWADTITPHMDPNRNASGSFAYFRGKLLEPVGKRADSPREPA